MKNKKTRFYLGLNDFFALKCQRWENYGTTLANIINKNNITTYSSAVTFNSGTTYYLKPTYKLVGGMDSNINNLNISLNTGTEMFTLTLG